MSQAKALDRIYDNLVNEGYDVEQMITGIAGGVIYEKVYMKKNDGYVMVGYEDSYWDRIISATCGFGYYVLPDFDSCKKLIGLRLISIKQFEAFKDALNEIEATVSKNYWVNQGELSAATCHKALIEAKKAVHDIDHKLYTVSKIGGIGRIGEPELALGEYREVLYTVYLNHLDMLDSAAFTPDELNPGKGFLLSVGITA